MADLFRHAYFIQGLGLIAFFLSLWAFSCKDDANLKKLTALYCAILVPHYYLLGAQSGAFAIFVSGLRAYLSLYKKLKHMGSVFILLYLILGVFSYQTWVDILPIFGSALMTFGFFYLRQVPMRFCLALGTLFWIAYNALVGSVAPFFMEVFILFANLRTIYVLSRFEKLEKNA